MPSEMFFCQALGSSIVSGMDVMCNSILVHTESTSHIRILVSSDADARNTPSGDQAMSEFPAVWPFKSRMRKPVKGFHILTTLSAPAFQDE